VHAREQMIKKDEEWDNKDGNFGYLDSQRKQTNVHACMHAHTHTHKHRLKRSREVVVCCICGTRLIGLAAMCTSVVGWCTWWCNPALTLRRSYIKRNLHMAVATIFQDDAALLQRVLTNLPQKGYAFCIPIYTAVWVPAIKLCNNSIIFLLVTIKL
jgi:hypothetical protein